MATKNTYKPYYVLILLFFLSSRVQGFGFPDPLGLRRFMPNLFRGSGGGDGGNPDEGGGGGGGTVEERKLEMKYDGSWQLISKNSGVSAMHVNLLPNNKIIMFDASAFHISEIKNPNQECIPFVDDKGVKGTDCWAHGVEFDDNTAKLRPLKMVWDPWCSSGGLAPDGTLVSTGGWLAGDKSVRYLKTCPTCDWIEYEKPLANSRWYATQQILPDGGFIVIGGRRSFSFEFVPREGGANPTAIDFPFLDQTTDLDENNLYPFVHLSTDGNLFIFANSRSVLFNPKTQKVIREYPVLEGGSRNYPASGMSALLPIKLQAVNNPVDVIPAEVIVCGGAKPEAYRQAEKGTFMPALQDCARLDITKNNDVWKKEQMPSRRVMGDMIMLPTGDLLMVNGATSGTSAWNFAEGPNFTPVLYSPDKPENQRFKELKPTNIARMYHSSAALLPDGKVLVGGSNTNPGYNFKAKYPTEMRIEIFSPPYLDPTFEKNRPEITIDSLEIKWAYGKPVSFGIKLQEIEPVQENDISVVIYPPPFTTHGYSMNQRLVVLGKTQVTRDRISVVAPPSGKIAPPGYYLLFVVYRGLPSVGAWVQIVR